MQLSDFKIGEVFTTNEGALKWRCTDKGTRVVTAISVNGNAADEKGPPYAVSEVVFDEYDLPGCEAA